MFTQLIQQQRQSLDYFFQKLDVTALEQVVEACLQAPGLIAVTGVGKSGIIAEKMAATLMSTGTRALYLPPTNLLHGDLGILSSQDVLMLISRSGETDELLSLLPFVRQKGARLIAVVSNLRSRLAQQCDLALELPVDRELCPFDLVPTTSTTAQLLFGDLLAISLMTRKGFGRERFALNHPAGALGRQLLTTVDELMCKGEALPLVGPSQRLMDSLVELTNKKCGALLVADEKGQLMGIFTDGDLRRALQRMGSNVLEQPMSELMTPSPLAIEKGSLAWEALKLMQRDPRRQVMVLPVLRSGQVEGLLHMHALIQAGFS
jgi:arabinose-5-phosphate isomerase